MHVARSSGSGDGVDTLMANPKKDLINIDHSLLKSGAIQRFSADYPPWFGLTAIISNQLTSFCHQRAYAVIWCERSYQLID